MSNRQSPKRIVLATFGSPGDLQPFLAIGTELLNRGHDPVVATSALYRETVLAANLGFAAVRPNRTHEQRDPDFLERLWQSRQSPEHLFREMFLPALRESFEDILPVVDRADVVVSHTLTPAAGLAAEYKRMPWVSAVMQPMGYLSAYEPPVLGATRISSALQFLAPRFSLPVLQGARRITAGWMREWHELRAELDLPASAAHPLWEGQHAPLRSLGLFPRILGAPQPDWPAQARVAGFPFYRPPGRALGPSVEAFLAKGEPPLVFTLGTTAVNDPGSFFEESIEAARLLGLRALLLVGRGRPELASVATDHVLVVPYAPHDLVFPRSLAAVHQGGIGTLSEAMLARKPMVIVPYGHDQFDNAWRASRLGIARTIPRRRYLARAVSQVLDRVVNDRQTHALAEHMGQHVVRDHGAIAAARMIEESIPGCSRKS